MLNEEVLNSKGLSQAIQTDASSPHNHGLIDLKPNKNHFTHCHTCAGSFIIFDLFCTRVHSSCQIEKDWHEHHYVQPVQMLILYVMRLLGSCTGSLINGQAYIIRYAPEHLNTTPITTR
jgi:hypothetical protein